MALSEDTILENRYRIDRLLGQGGMGAIYRGFDTRLKRQVAIKENFFQTPQAIQQFEREAVMLADLTHLNLPRVIDHFSFEGQQYLVMDFIEGQDLWEMVKRQEHPLSEAQALDYIIQVCEAVQYLHTRKPPIIHRDIKPQNIKITPEGLAVLVDFGIAKMAEGGQRTSTGARGVTPGFSPLEQYAGSGTSPVSDVYSLGATLYAVLTGQKPPDSASRMVNQADFVPPIKLNAKLSERVSQAIEYAMQPQPADRPQSVAVWQQELEAIQTAMPTTPFDEDPTVMASPEKADVPTTLPSPTTPPSPDRGRVGEGVPPAKSGPPWLLIGGSIVIIVLIGAIAFFALSGGDDSGDEVAVTSTPATSSTEVLVAEPTAVSVDNVAGNDEEAIALDDQPEDEPTVVFVDTTTSYGDIIFHESTITITLNDLEPPDEGFIYAAWLVEPEATPLHLGTIEAEGGEISFTDPEGRDLLMSFSSFAITEEPESNLEPVLSGAIIYEARVDTQVIFDYHHLKNISDVSIDQAIRNGMVTQANGFTDHTGFSLADILNNDSLNGGKNHAEHAINIASGVGSDDYFDWDGDGRPENPGDDVGLLTYVRLFANAITIVDVDIANEVNELITQIEGHVSLMMKITASDTLDEAAVHAEQLNAQQGQILEKTITLLEETQTIDFGTRFEVFATGN
jgi:serine/threonine protein kinase